MKKSNGGFSLIELIVVIAIMAILAGVSIPTYVSYIAKANDAAALEVLNEVKTAVIADAAEQGKTVDSITVNGSTVTASSSGVSISISTYANYLDNGMDNVSSMLAKSKSYSTGAAWTSSSGWSAASN
ncbi:MAG: prepilin-type N-terminal cleavage/methylation domain-containing protein [Lachnospiraceae bacterium]|nr:prepilin-type N-terminal cleavage/methylation domain-containing protein [Lachnospiraceae bacterium]